MVLVLVLVLVMCLWVTSLPWPMTTYHPMTSLQRAFPASRFHHSAINQVSELKQKQKQKQNTHLPLLPLPRNT